jgi:hypothetical protein
LVTTAGDEMQVSGSIKTFGLVVHCNKVEARESERGDRTHPSPVMKAESRKSPLLEKREKGGTPGVFASDLKAKWGYTSDGHRGHPPSRGLRNKVSNFCFSTFISAFC